MTIAELIDQWLAFRASLCAAGGIARSTLDNQGQVAGTLRARVGAHKVAELRKSHLDLYVAQRAQTCQPVTVAAEVMLLRQILNWAVDEKLLLERPRMPTVSVPNIEKPLPADDDYAWYLRTMSERHADALFFMLLTGLAPHELARLQCRDEDRAAAQVNIGYRDDFAVKQAARRRPVPLNAAARTLWIKWTLGWPADHAPFPSPDALQKAMRRHFLDSKDAPAGADGLTPKMMRKWFASKVSLESSEAVLQRLLGHAPGSPITRKHYVRSSDLQLRNAVEILTIK